jgi:hypothetical protein
VVDFVVAVVGDCQNCKAPGAKMRDVLTIRVPPAQRRLKDRLAAGRTDHFGTLFTFSFLSCQPCFVEAQKEEPQLCAEYAALLEAGQTPAAAAGQLARRAQAAFHRASAAA